MSRRLGTLVLACAVCLTPTSAAPGQDAVPRALAHGLSPEEAARAMSVPEGFEVRLCAGEPDVRQPIAMAFDDRGRLWVAEAYSYPNRLPEDGSRGAPRDRVLIFEDVDGDDRFDKRTVFFEGLNLVSGLEIGFGGAWVGAAPHLLFIPDADGDDRPDGKPQVVLDGWGWQDTHETLNSFIWGPDGWLYGCHGVFTHSHVGPPGAPASARTRLNAGVWRLHPTRKTFELFAEGTSNPWGVDFNDLGHAFCAACVIPHLYHVIQGARYQRQAGQHFNPHVYDDIKTIARHRHWTGNQWSHDDRAKSSAVGGGHAHAGAMIYLGGAWPARYHNQLFMNNIHGARLNQDLLTRRGSGYQGDAAPDFCFANDSWSQMLYLTYGPDGQVTVIDWCDRNQCHHGDAAAHDRANGRVFKIRRVDSSAAAKKAAQPGHPDEPLNLAKLSDGELVDLQGAANEWHARHARRLLQERAAAGQLSDGQLSDGQLSDGQLSDGAASRLARDVFAPGKTPRRLRALWALHVIGALRDEQKLQLLADEDADIRAWTIQLAVESGRPADRLLARFAELANNDPSPVTRLYLAAALQRLPLEARWPIAEGLLSHAEDAADHNLPLMIWYGVEPLVPADPARALELARQARAPLAARYMARRAAADEAAHEPLLAAVGAAPPATQAWMLDEIVAALKTRAGFKAPAAWHAAYDKLRASENEVVRRQADFVALKFGDRRVLPSLRATLADAKAPLESRRFALESALAARDPELPPTLHALLADAALRPAAIRALAAFDHADTPQALLAAYKASPRDDQQAIIAALSARPAHALRLLDAVAAGRVPRQDLSAFTVRQLADLGDAAVLKRLQETWGAIRATSADKAALLATHKARLTPAALAQANLPRGRELWQKTCAACHKLFGAGAAIGPDLTGSNRANLDYLLENLLDPSAVVGKDYQTTLVVTENGRALSGLVKLETDTALTLQTPTDVVTLEKAEIASRKLTNLSLMPEGQLQELGPEAARDLVAYLASPTQVPLPGEGPWLDPTTGRAADALEGEALRVLSVSAGSAAPQNMSGFKLGKWSGASHLWWTGGKPGAKLVLELPVARAGRYEVYVGLTKAIDYGEARLAINDAPASAAVDLYHDGVVNTPPLSLGAHDLKVGPARLTIEITGANPAAVKSHMVGLDYVYLAPRPAAQGPASK